MTVDRHACSRRGPRHRLDPVTARGRRMAAHCGRGRGSARSSLRCRPIWHVACAKCNGVKGEPRGKRIGTGWPREQADGVERPLLGRRRPQRGAPGPARARHERCDSRRLALRPARLVGGNRRGCGRHAVDPANADDAHDRRRDTRDDARSRAHGRRPHRRARRELVLGPGRLAQRQGARRARAARRARRCASRARASGSPSVRPGTST